MGRGYGVEWEPPGKRLISARELEFLTRSFQRTPGRRALDVGVGSGRIIAELLRLSTATTFVGLDIAEAMVGACRERFAGEARVTGLHVSDIAADAVPSDETFDFITAVRILKYSEKWAEIVAKLGARLSREGVLALSMPNSRSLNRFSRPYAVPWHAASMAQIDRACRAAGLVIVDAAGSTRLPYVLYNAPRSPLAVRLVWSADRAFDRALGCVAGTRELFVAVRRAPDAGAPAE